MRFIYTTLIFSISFALSLEAISSTNVCAFTFNSANEKHVISKAISPFGVQVTELVPSDSNDPNWLEKSCEQLQRCDISIFSGHFGGVFYGERSSSTLSLPELIKAKSNKKCAPLFYKSNAVYLMGCNTLATKEKDHRSVYEYVETLVNEGFPLYMAQKVAGTRYINYGESIKDIMHSLFSEAEYLIGFKSTGPLGKYAGPLIENAASKSSAESIRRYGVDLKELQQQFHGTSISITSPTNNLSQINKQDALTFDAQTALSAWERILSNNNLDNYLNFIVENKSNPYLKHKLRYDLELKSNLKQILLEKLQQAKSLTILQLEISDFLRYHQLISKDEFNTMFSNFLKPLVEGNIDYIMASQLCYIFKKYPKNTSKLEQKKFFSGINKKYDNYLKQCRGIISPSPETDLSRCAKDTASNGWQCLSRYQRLLDVKGCKLIAESNSDIDNADDMLWYCYSKMKRSKTLDKAQCLELTDSFQILGNQLKMNWNCLNRIN